MLTPEEQVRKTELEQILNSYTPAFWIQCGWTELKQALFLHRVVELQALMDKEADCQQV